VRLLIFSDIHTDWKTLERLLSVDADYYIAAGDQVTWARNFDRCGEINHESESDVSRMCARYGLHDFHERHLLVGKWHVAGLGYSNPTPFNTPGEYTEQQIADRLQRFAEFNPLVLICHAPPYDTPLDQIRPGVHAGSRSVRQFIDRYQPAYFFCGHIHEAEGVAAELGKTRAWNVGKKGHLLELN
jgi:Icc-related predicted phosphoesterase